MQLKLHTPLRYVMDIEPTFSTTKTRKPVIGIVGSGRVVEGYSIQATNQFFIDVVQDFGGIPLTLLAPLSDTDADQILTMVDGIILPGGSTHVAPRHFGATYEEHDLDENRDALALALIAKCVAGNIPILGICRGFQEMNVALGGTLHRRLDDENHHLDHQAPQGDFPTKFGPSHGVALNPQGLFQKWLPESQELAVNSLHLQGVDQIALALTVEATAPDGLVEAFSLPKHPFFVGVQWHPEWNATHIPFSHALFTAFLHACGERIEP